MAQVDRITEDIAHMPLAVFIFRDNESSMVNYSLDKRLTITIKFISNKHCEILVSCSDEERNCIQAHKTSCKVMELHGRSRNCMQARETSCKLMELHVSPLNFMKVKGTACKLL